MRILTNSDVSGSSLPRQVAQLSIYALCIEGRNLRLFIDAQTIGLEVPTIEGSICSLFDQYKADWLDRSESCIGSTTATLAVTQRGTCATIRVSQDHRGARV